MISLADLRLLVARASQRALLYGGDEAGECWEERWRWSDRISHPPVVILVPETPKLGGSNRKRSLLWHDLGHLPWRQSLRRRKP